MTPQHLAPFLVLISGLAHAIVNALVKAGKDKLSGRAMLDSVSAILVLPAAFLVPVPTGAWPWLIGSWAVHLVYLVALIKAFEHTDMTIAYPIARGIAPMLAAAGAVLLFDEPINGAVILGIILVSAGVIGVGFGRGVPLPALGWSGLTGASIAVYTVIDAEGVRAAPSAASYIVWTFLFLGGGIGLVFAAWRGRQFLVIARDQWRPGLVAGALSIVTYGLALLAFRWGATPRLAALRETSILFGTGIAVIFLKERLTPARTVGILLIGGGAITLLARG